MVLILSLDLLTPQCSPTHPQLSLSSVDPAA